MCGIAGYIYFDKQLKAKRDILQRMTDCMTYRGPDGEGFYVEGPLALGHRRLSIIDPSLGAQPFLSEDGKKILIFNGEIFNYLELKEELVQAGHSFRTASDTEVLMKAYEVWGHECQNKFNGMWAFALWDDNRQELFLSRDRLGEKPLHYGSHKGAFVFGSELKCLFEFGLPKQIRHELMEVYLALTVIPAPDTFYKDLFKLMPGHYLLVKEGEVVEKTYWEFPQKAEKDLLTNKEEVYRKFEELLEDAVRIRMRSDVPFGAFLSGGLDSSAIVSLMAKNSRHPVKTFTMGFEDPAFDESNLAEELAQRFKTEHHRKTVLPGDLKHTINNVFAHCDEPFGDSSAIPTDLVSAYAAREVKMVLTGDGGDELLSGYTSYKALKVSQSLGRYLPGILINLLQGAVNLCSRLSKGALRYRLLKIETVLKMSCLPFEQRMAEQLSFTPLSDIKALTVGIKGLVPIESYLKNLLSKCRFQDDFYKLMYVHYHHSLPNDFLVKVDRMSMAHSLETRLPFLDYRLVEFMAGVHKDVKLQAWELKSVLRKTLGQSLPAGILKAPKRGFAIPLRDWFKEESFNRVVNESLQQVKQVLNETIISKLLAENREGKKDHGNFIWALLQLDRALAAIGS